MRKIQLCLAAFAGCVLILPAALAAQPCSACPWCTTPTKCQAIKESTLIVVVVSVLLAASPGWQGQPGLRAQSFEEVWATAGTPPNEFIAVGGAIPLGSGVLVSDPNAGAVYLYNPATGATDLFARKGAGPGEVQTPTLFTRSEGITYLYDLGARSIEAFSTDGTFIERVLLRRWVTNPKGFVVLPRHGFVISGGMFMDPGAVHLFNWTGEHVRSWIENASDAVGVRTWLHTAGGPVATDSAGRLFLSQSAPHQIWRMDPSDRSGEDPVRVASDDTLLVPMTDRTFYRTRQEGGRTISSPQWFYDKSSWLGIRDDGTLVNVVTRRDRGDSLWEWWNGSQLLRRIRVDTPYVPLFVYPNGDFLVTYVRPSSGEHLVARVRWR